MMLKSALPPPPWQMSTKKKKKKKNTEKIMSCTSDGKDWKEHLPNGKTKDIAAHYLSEAETAAVLKACEDADKAGKPPAAFVDAAMKAMGSLVRFKDLRVAKQIGSTTL
jgi:hypothetical protein